VFCGCGFFMRLAARDRRAHACDRYSDNDRDTPSRAHPHAIHPFLCSNRAVHEYARLWASYHAVPPVSRSLKPAAFDTQGRPCCAARSSRLGQGALRPAQRDRP
jgi:hypothetical protein